MQEVEKEDSPKLRKLYTQQSMTSGYQFRVHNSSFVNLRRGLMERVFFVENKETKTLEACPEPKPHVFKHLRPLKKLFVRYCGFHTPISAQEFVDCYQGRKRTIYQQAADSLGERALEAKDSQLKTFIKAEKFNLSAKPDPAPRVIQPRAPRYNVELGKYLKKYEHHAYRALDKIWGGPTVMKGYSVEEVGMHIWNAWSDFQIPVAVGFDMSRFDQHVSESALEFEHSCYAACFKGDQHLINLLKMQLRNHGIGFASNGIIRYTKEGCRMSGDMNTALGNCLLACLITKYITTGIRARLINNGDDCVLICEKSDLHHVVSNLTTKWLEFGFNCIAEDPVYEIEEIRFCQMAPIYDGETWLMVRDPKISLSKDSFSMVPWNTIKVAKQWMKAVGQCGIRVAGGVPIVQEYYQAYIRVGDGVKENRNIVEQSAAGFYKMAEHSKRGYTKVSEEARFSFWKAFGIEPDLQIAIENAFRTNLITCEVGETPLDLADPISWTLRQTPK